MLAILGTKLRIVQDLDTLFDDKADTIGGLACLGKIEKWEGIKKKNSDPRIQSKFHNEGYSSDARESQYNVDKLPKGIIYMLIFKAQNEILMLTMNEFSFPCLVERTQVLF